MSLESRAGRTTTEHSTRWRITLQTPPWTREHRNKQQQLIRAKSSAQWPNFSTTTCSTG